MRKYKIVIIGALLISLGILVMSAPTLANEEEKIRNKIQEILITNFPELQEVLIANTEPIDINIVNQAQEPSQREVLITNTEPFDINVVDQEQELEPKVVVFWDNECDLSSGAISPVKEVEGYSKIIIHSFATDSIQLRAEVSVDSSNWSNQKYNHWFWTGRNTPEAFDVIGSYYRILILSDPSGQCLTVKGYLIP